MSFNDELQPDAAAPAWQKGPPEERVHRAEDKPFDRSIALRDGAALLADLALPCPPDPKIAAAVQTWLANLIWRAQMGDASWVFYSRDKDHYTGLSRYAAKFYRRPIMIAAVDWLVAHGLVVHHKTKPSPSALFRSRLRATAAFHAQLQILPAAVTTCTPQERIVLRDADGRALPYRETASTAQMRRDVEAHNAFLASLDITLDHPEAHLDAHGFLVVSGQRLDPGRKAYYRVFNGTFRRGGRWYGPWWQSLPKCVRAHIRINGEPTAEPDICGCHMRLLCASAGLDIGDSDPYVLSGFPRDEVKAAVNIMLNANNWHSARGAFIERYEQRYGALAAARRAGAIRAALNARYPALAPYWNSGYGLVLQGIDADICRRLQRTRPAKAALRIGATRPNA
jgi:hypothetical protein